MSKSTTPPGSPKNNNNNNDEAPNTVPRKRRVRPEISLNPFGDSGGGFGIYQVHRNYGKFSRIINTTNNNFGIYGFN